MHLLQTRISSSESILRDALDLLAKQFEESGMSREDAQLATRPVKLGRVDR